MNSCYRCGGKFGLIRHYVHRFMHGTLSFCSRKCKQAYVDGRSPDLKFLRFLTHHPPNA
jgi:hypothetical protein